MTGRTGSAEESKGSSSGRPLLVGALALALAATGVLVLSDDGRLLRLGIVAALWAALVGAFLAAKYRKQALDRDDEAADMQAVYELELEREVYARREYELQVEAEAKRKAEEESREHIDDLRKELGSLRDTLQALLGGEVLVERFALQAEATRMRSLPEDSRPLVSRKSTVKRLNPSQREDIVVPGDAQTELIDRVMQPAREPGAGQGGRGAGSGGRGDRQQPRETREAREVRRPAPKPQRTSREPQRPVRPSRPGGHDDQWFDRLPVEEPGTVEGSGWWDPVTPPEQEQQGRGRATPGAAGSGGVESTRKVSAAEESQGRLAERLDLGRSRDDQGGESRAPRPQPGPAERNTPPGRAEPRPEPATSVVPPVAPPAAPVGQDGRGRRPEDRTTYTAPARGQTGAEGLSKARGEGAMPPPGSGRRRAADSGQYRPVGPTQEEQSQGDNEVGRRRKAADESGHQDVQAWQQTEDDDDQPSGRRARGRSEQADPKAQEPSGSHSEGKSVTELLAAHGGTNGPRRRRRRSE